jgi:hypothetical protein
MTEQVVLVQAVRSARKWQRSPSHLLACLLLLLLAAAAAVLCLVKLWVCCGWCKLDCTPCTPTALTLSTPMAFSSSTTPSRGVLAISGSVCWLHTRQQRHTTTHIKSAAGPVPCMVIWRCAQSSACYLLPTNWQHGMLRGKLDASSPRDPSVNSPCLCLSGTPVANANNRGLVDLEKMYMAQAVDRAHNKTS